MPPSQLAALGERYLRELFEHSPADARSEGDHRFDGRLGPVGAGVTARRVAELDALAGDVETVNATTVEERADLVTLRHRIALERFHLAELRSDQRNPLSILFRGADPQPYCAHDYAPVADRAAGLAAHLEGLPDWLAAATDDLDIELDEGPRAIAVDVSRRLRGFFSDDLATALPLPDDARLERRLAEAGSAAAAACGRFADTLEARAGATSTPLGEDKLLAMLHAQEGVTEDLASLRRIAEDALTALRGEFEEVAGVIVPGGDVGEALRRMEDDHPTAEQLIPEAASSLERVREFWRERAVITIPDERCQVEPAPPYQRWASAMFDPAGAFAAPGIASTYIVTPVDDTMTATEAEEWLRSFNRWLLENVGVHEVYPGHFVHFLHGRAQANPVRRTGFVAGFGEGWAHYTEQLAVEQGLADGRPLLHLAQLQDALLRACRFRSALMLHTEGAAVADATALFMRWAGVPEFTARREAERGTYDPMYLAYTYGKLQILAWRAELERRGGFDMRRFHDTLVGSGFPPLAAVRELALA